MVKIFFATDLHGSTVCFRKFLNAPKFYGADIAFLGGDYCSKDLILYARGSAGWEAVSGTGERATFKATEDFERFCASAEVSGKMLNAVDSGVVQAIMRESYNHFFKDKITELLDKWVGLAYEKWTNNKIPINVIPGNDDPPYTDQIFTSGPFRFLHRRCVEIESGVTVLGWGGSNPTPWQTIRELSEEDIGVQLAETYASGHADHVTILFVHPPPLGSGLDIAPMITRDFSYSFSMGSVRRKAIGSSAVRTFVEQHQPVLGLFGHVHEGRGHQTIGKTVCLNPGSSFSTGRLQGCLITLEGGKVMNFEFTEG